MPTQQILILVVMAAAFYFLLIRPQQQQSKRQAETVASLEPGTHILTIGGIHATVVSVTDDRVRVAIADGSELEIAKRAVASILPDDADEVDDDDDDVADDDEVTDDAPVEVDPDQETLPDV